MAKLILFRRMCVMITFMIAGGVSVYGQTARDLVKGNLIQFNDNGGWCWYQDERAVIDVSTAKLLLGSDGSSAGVGGSPRSGDVEAVLTTPHLKSGNILSYGHIETLIDGEVPAGSHKLRWKANGLPSGVYIYRMCAGRYSDARKMIYQK
jgi:hypothetical protein